MSNGVKFENYIFYKAEPPKMEKSISIVSLKMIKFVKNFITYAGLDWPGGTPEKIQAA